MMLWKKLKKLYRNKQKINNGQIYHEHYFQIIVSKEELKIQLHQANHNTNLLCCLAFGKTHPNYEQWLLLSSIKFQFLGSLFYPVNQGKNNCSIQHTDKLSAKFYRDIFDSSMDTLTEAKHWLKQHDVKNMTAEQLLKKYIAVKTYCIRMLISKSETYFASEYRYIIDYIANHDNFLITFKNKGTDIPTLADKSDLDVSHMEYDNYYE